MTTPAARTTRATSATPATPATSKGLHWAVDLLLGVLLVAAEGAVVLIFLAATALSARGLDGSRGGNGGNGGSSNEPAEGRLIIGLLVAAAFTALLTWLFFRSQAPFLGASQVLACLVLLVAALVGAADEHQRDNPDPKPTSTYRGTYGQCFSGGDNHECRGG
ncbi:DUF6234 family protein [Streptomyces bambusae]|uniref:DUF6234 domain-containing protein n=1 Tax=Streptomyces bambusae TaxID=1550616 RepID=A0ABS6Z107_9ACTN|nr:DUF6234 family protein [Streptomyces bambusae]MBW5481435.1 hypothetical protein [Streptomyces bambusae]